MTKTIALVALAAIQIAVSLANYWFTFGLWPRSWGAFVFFSLTSIVIVGLMRAVAQEEQ